MDRPVEAPTFILGWYRTGTTALHNLLQSSPDHRSFATWELIEPIPLSKKPRLDWFRRRGRARGVVIPARLTIPDPDPVHPLLLESSGEEFFLLENELVGPTSLWNVGALHQAFWGAMFVFPHRAPVSALTNACSCCAITSAKAVRKLDLEGIGQFWLNYNELGLEHSAEERRVFSSVQQIEVPSAAMSAAPVATGARIQEQFGIDFGALRRRLVSEHATSGQGLPKSKHR